MKFIKFFFLLTALSIYTKTEIINTGHAEVSLIKDTYQENQFIVGIKMDMQKDWHTYWKNPGDSGGPIEVQWSYNENSTQISDVLWPAPELIPYPPLMTYGYKDFVVFPFIFSPNNSSAETSNTFLNTEIEAEINFLICDDVCVPEKAFFKTTLNNIVEDILVSEWLNNVPEIELPTLIEIHDGFIELRFSYNENIEKAYLFIENPDIVLHAATQELIKEENNWLIRVPTNNNDFNITSIEGILSVNEKNYIVNSNNSQSQKNSSSVSFLQALIFAFIGGLILNLMPCVFPIISLKVLSFVSMGNKSQNKVRAHALSFSLGGILSFSLIGFLLLILRAAGETIGWGFQLQSPLVVGILTILMFVIGMVLLTDLSIGSSLTKLGSVGGQSIFGSFLTGVLAVVVASPCTAPFMGAALGYALIQSSTITLPIFLSLGVGFVLPYLILAFNPKLINFMPKPGKWMIILKEFFAFPMFATSLWLLWVLSFQTSSGLTIGLLISLLAISLLIWIINKISNTYIKIVPGTFIFLIICYQTFLLYNYEKSNLEINQSIELSNSDYTKWYPGLEEEFQNKNQAFLINFTAAWCITCQANDKIALSRPNIKNYLIENNIEYVVADWTNKDESILKALEAYNRSGVPLYIYWKPGMQNSKTLPAILTEQILLENF